MASVEEFFNCYFDYVGENECPTIFHRWSIVSAVAALLELDYYMMFGHFRKYPSLYVMLMGKPGSRKSTSITLAKKLLRDIGYSKFGSDRMAPEAFLAEMQRNGANMDKLDKDLKEDISEDEIMDTLLGRTMDDFDEAAHSSSIYLCPDEFLDLVGPSNIDFLTLLTKLYDEHDQYKNPKQTKESVIVTKPCVNLLCGNTPQNLTITCPPEMIGHGFSSRIVFVYSENKDTRLFWPSEERPEKAEAIKEWLRKIKELSVGEVTVTPEAKRALKEIYEKCPPLDDHRFLYYSQRRYEICMKIALIFSAIECEKTLTEQNVIDANTMLHYTEARMPKALGEYGFSKDSQIKNAIMNIILNNFYLPRSEAKLLNVSLIWKEVSNDLRDMQQLVKLLVNLEQGGKIAITKDGIIPVFKPRKLWDKRLIRQDFLTMEEMR